VKNIQRLSIVKKKEEGCWPTGRSDVRLSTGKSFYARVGGGEEECKIAL